MSTITLVRHGQASFGTADYDRLSAVGMRQARLLGEWWAHCREPAPPVVVCGTMRRHRETADACLGAWGTGAVERRIDPGFDEFDHGDVLARLRPDLAEPGGIARFLAASDDPHRAFQRLFAGAVARWASGEHDGEYRESWAAFKARCAAALGRMADLGGGERPVAVFTSGGPIGAVVQHLLGIPDDRILELHWTLLNGGVTRLRHRGGRSTVIGVNAVPHLEATGESSLITHR